MFSITEPVMSPSSVRDVQHFIYQRGHIKKYVFESQVKEKLIEFKFYVCTYSTEDIQHCRAIFVR